MRVSVVAFTRHGLELARQVAGDLADQGDEVLVNAPARLVEGLDVHPLETVMSWAQDAWTTSDALLFISACGIAIRAIAPLVQDKMHDPAVVCMDERGKHVVPLLSGHIGGANSLARRVAALCGGEAVLTTATDVNGCFAVDEWAASQNLAILDRAEAKEISVLLLDGGAVGLVSDVPVSGNPPEGVLLDDTTRNLGISLSLDPDRRPFAKTLRLVPHVVTVGMGCKRGTGMEALSQALDEALTRARVAREAVTCLATIDLKGGEAGLLQLAEALGVPLRLHSAEELASVPGAFSSSAFVLRTVGVDNVCERAACARGETLLLGRQRFDGVTVAIAALPARISFAEREEGECP